MAPSSHRGGRRGRQREREREWDGGAGQRGREREERARENVCAPATSSLPTAASFSSAACGLSLGAFPAQAATLPMSGGSASSGKTPDGPQLFLPRPRSGKWGLKGQGLASRTCPQEAGQEIFPRLPLPGLSPKSLGGRGLGFLAHAALVKPESHNGQPAASSGAVADPIRSPALRPSKGGQPKSLSGPTPEEISLGCPLVLPSSHWTEQSSIDMDCLYSPPGWTAAMCGPQLGFHWC